ncbi:Lpg1974 family pore-forming outer membrane protein [Neorhodopirellula lusitana]|uniref:Lpg1974 family pore-forming outer membrane protein n=1 Tax=Neorhodopirellula lusitana TaxID=445327 RepID=UPI0038504E7E
MLRTVVRGSRRIALALTIASTATFGGVASATDGLPPELVASLYTDTDEGAAGEEIAQCSCGSASCGGCENGYEVSYSNDCAYDQTCSMPEQSHGLLDSLKQRRSKAIACAPPWWAHRTGIFGEYLYLTAGSSDLIYALEGTDSNPDNSTPTGPAGIVDMDAESGFRTGFTLAASACSSLNVAYTRWDGQSTDSINATGINVLNSQLLHPSLDNAGTDSLASNATHKMNFQTVDVNYRHLWKRTNTMAINWLAGLRYSNLEQTLNSEQTFSAPVGLASVDTQIDFEGFGLTGGLDLERYSCETGLFIYGKAMASLLAGDWKASYRQTDQFGGGVAANDYEDFHATPILEGEIGLGWRNKSGRVRLQSGYMMAGWYEAVSTRGYIDAVRSSEMIDIGEAITFSGLTSRLTVSF